MLNKMQYSSLHFLIRRLQISVELLRNHEPCPVFRPLLFFFLHSTKAMCKDNEIESRCINSTNHWAESDNQKGKKYRRCRKSPMKDNCSTTLICVSKPAVIYQLSVASALLPVQATLHLKPKAIVLPLTIAYRFLRDQHKLKKDIITHRHTVFIHRLNDDGLYNTKCSLVSMELQL